MTVIFYVKCQQTKPTHSHLIHNLSTYHTIYKFPLPHPTNPLIQSNYIHKSKKQTYQSQTKFHIYIHTFQLFYTKRIQSHFQIIQLQTTKSNKRNRINETKENNKLTNTQINIIITTIPTHINVYTLTHSLILILFTCLVSDLIIT